MKGSFVGKAKGGKLLRLSIEAAGGVVTALSVRGDFFAHPEERFDELEAGLVGCPVEELGARFGSGAAALGLTIYGLLPEDLDAAVAAIRASGPTP